MDKVHNAIERTDKAVFTVSSSVTATEYDEAGTKCRSTDTQMLVLCFSDKKNAISELKALYKAQGIPDHAATAMAKDVFAKATLVSVKRKIAVCLVDCDLRHMMVAGSVLYPVLLLRICETPLDRFFSFVIELLDSYRLPNVFNKLHVIHPDMLEDSFLMLFAMRAFH